MGPNQNMKQKYVNSLSCTTLSNPSTASLLLNALSMQFTWFSPFITLTADSSAGGGGSTQAADELHVPDFFQKWVVGVEDDLLRGKIQLWAVCIYNAWQVSSYSLFQTTYSPSWPFRNVAAHAESMLTKLTAAKITSCFTESKAMLLKYLFLYISLNQNKLFSPSSATLIIEFQPVTLKDRPT